MASVLESDDSLDDCPSQLNFEDVADIPTEQKSEFIPRDYQVELFQCALEQNTIVYLPTGSGKTFIAALLIKEKSEETVASLESGGKRTVFLVPTVALAIQQAEYLRRHTHLRVQEYYGSMGVDLWGKNKWQLEFEKNQAVVMTAQIFVDILNHAFFPADKVNLLVFDECHAAVKDAPMMQVLSKLETVDEDRRPKILGLTAALFRKKCKPGQVNGIIRQLSTAMKCRIRTPTDIDLVYRHSTNPCQMILQYESSTADTNPRIRALSERIVQIAGGLCQDISSQQLSGKTEMLLSAPKKILHMIEAFGIYGVYHTVRIYLEFLPRLKERARILLEKADFDRIIRDCEAITRLCEAEFASHSRLDRLLMFVHPRVHRLLELLRQMSPVNVKDDPEKVPKMCAIVFVERRDTANVLYHFLKEISEVDPVLRFIRPLFTMGQAAGRASLLKEANILNMKQREIMTEFRNGIVNLLVATSVLEEGIDIPECNLIVRFDRCKTYCDYVQAKGRARAKKAFYVLMVSDEDSGEYVDELMQYHSIEQLLMNHDDDSSDWESRLEMQCEHLIPPYAPFGTDGPRITMQSSISLINRYCSILSSSSGEVLAPMFDVVNVEEKDVPRAWLMKIEEALEGLPKPKPNEAPGLYKCSLLLPLNSPLREEVTGDAMPSKRMAKRAVALKACQLLHQMDEFDHAHLLPKCRATAILDEEEEEEDEEVVGKSSNTIPRRYPDGFRDCRPLPGEANFIYSIIVDLVEPSLDEKKFFLPETVPICFGIVTSKPIPTLCPFPLVTRAGIFEVRLEGCDVAFFEKEECALLESFHEFLFRDVIFLFKKQLPFNLDESTVQCLVVPLRAESKRIDFEFICQMISAPKIAWEARPTFERYEFDANLFQDTVVVPWYQPFKKPMPYYVDCLSSLTPLSKFPDNQALTYRDYFADKYEYNIKNTEQRLVQVSLELSHKNFLLPRPQCTRVERETHLVAEMCYVHPCPASVWKQAVWIPSILQRVYQLMLAEQVRLKIVDEMPGPKIGQEHVPHNQFWKPITIRHLTNTKDEDPLPRTPSPGEKRKHDEVNDSSDVDSSGDELMNSLDIEDMMWCLDYHSSSGPEVRRARPVRSGEKWTDIQKIEPQEEWTDETLNMSFDSLKTTQEYGPSPGQILEAFTLTRTGEGFDMERYEAIGDSILKLITSIYVYGKYDKYDEGTLTSFRMRQINNKNLAKLGTAKQLPSVLSCYNLKVTENFLPPGFLPPDISDGRNPYTEQHLASKNIADSVEALIGLYLTTNGIEGSLRIMEWLGLKTLPKIEQCNATNGFPILKPAPPPLTDPTEIARMLSHLFAGLESFEQMLGYSFKNKQILIEAFTHPSYIVNRLTPCYQKLEFLGDSVLDYLVTRFFYENPRQFSPGVLTDLRSAMVNNETFAVIAVRNGFHRYLKYESHGLSVALDRFVRTQEGNGHALVYNYFEFENVEGEKVAVNMEVPKVLGDIFESVAGAIFIDSEMSLDAVWRTYMPFMRQELEDFGVMTPLSPVRELYETLRQNLKFEKGIRLADGRWCVGLTIDGRTFKGVGPNSKMAKCALAKYALSVIKS